MHKLAKLYDFIELYSINSKDPHLWGRAQCGRQTWFYCAGSEYPPRRRPPAQQNQLWSQPANRGGSRIVEVSTGNVGFGPSTTIYQECKPRGVMKGAFVIGRINSKFKNSRSIFYSPNQRNEGIPVTKLFPSPLRPMITFKASPKSTVFPKSLIYGPL